MMKLMTATQDMLMPIMQLITECIKEMQNKGIDQWGDYYPTEEIVADDIRQRNLYFFELQNEIAGIATLNEQTDPAYSTIQWLANVEHPLIVHRLVISPGYQGQGYGQMTMQWVEEYAKQQGYPSIRLDAYQGNPAALSLYEKNEYIKTGEILFPHRSKPFNIYEKILNGNHTPNSN